MCPAVELFVCHLGTKGPDFEPDSDVISVDLAAVFADADPRSQTFCHGGRSSCGQVYRNVGLELETGKALATQRIYRAE